MAMHGSSPGNQTLASRRSLAPSRSDARSRGTCGGFDVGGGSSDRVDQRPLGKAPALNANEMPANKMPKWKREHAAFQQALSANRRIAQAKAKGVPLSTLPPPPPQREDLDDRVPCPHCGRKFNEKAAERHIPKYVKGHD